MLLLHISDIHFRKDISDTNYDTDAVYRDALIADVKKSTERLGAVDRIIVGGDIAFAGREEEYQIAEHWLSALQLASKCPDGGIKVVPGNHDVDGGLKKQLS